MLSGSTKDLHSLAAYTEASHPCSTHGTLQVSVHVRKTEEQVWAELIQFWAEREPVVNDTSPPGNTC